MSKKIDIIKKEKVKQGLIDGKSYKQAALDAGFAPSSANNATKLSSVKQCQEEILGELRESDVTVELIIKRINEDRDLAKKKKDASTMLNADIALGKYLAMFTDSIKHSGQIEYTQAEKDELRALHNRLAGITPLVNEGCS